MATQDTAESGMTDASRSILDSFRYIVRSMRRSSRASEKDFGVSTAQLFVLQILYAHGGLSINELASLTLTDQSSVSTVVSRLCDRQLASKVNVPGDGRRVQVELSLKGAELAQSIRRTEQDTWIKVLNAMPVEKRTSLALLLRTFIADAGIAEGEPSAELFFEESEAPFNSG